MTRPTDPVSKCGAPSARFRPETKFALRQGTEDLGVRLRLPASGCQISGEGPPFLQSLGPEIGNSGNLSGLEKIGILIDRRRAKLRPIW